MRATLPTPGRMPKGSFFTDEFLPYLLNEVANRRKRIHQGAITNLPSG